MESQDEFKILSTEIFRVFDRRHIEKITIQSRSKQINIYGDLVQIKRSIKPFEESLGNLTMFRDYSYSRVEGSVNVSNMGVLSLEGAPKVISGNLLVSGNRVRSFKGVESVIGGNLDISGNPTKEVPSGIVVKGRIINNSGI